MVHGDQLHAFQGAAQPDCVSEVITPFALAEGVVCGIVSDLAADQD